MKKTKRILAIIGVVLLVGMYASTLLFAFIDKSASQWLLKSSIVFTILLPVLLYAYTMIYKYARKQHEEEDETTR